MEDWEDWGLSLGIAGLLLSCFVVGCIKVYKFNTRQPTLLDNPV